MYYCIHCRIKTKPVSESQVVCTTKKGREYLQEICDVCKKKKSVFVKAAVLAGLPPMKTAAPNKKERKIKHKTESIV